MRAPPPPVHPLLRAVLAALMLPLAIAAAADEPRRIGPFDADLRDGLVYADDSRGLRVDLDGRFALDGMIWGPDNRRDDVVRMDRALLGVHVEGRDHVEGRITADLDGIDTRWGLWEAWLSYAPGPWVRVSAGLLPIPLGIEDTWGEGGSPLPGRPGFLGFLVGRTDWALRLDGEVREGLVYYELTGALGEGYDLHGQRRGDAQLSARVTSYPLRWLDWSVGSGDREIPLLSGLFVNGAYAWSPDDYSGELDVSTPFRNKLFDTDRLDGRGARLWTFGYGIDFGPVRAFHEFTSAGIEDVALPGGGRRDFDDQITAWQAGFSWRLTGEHYDSRPFRRRDARRPDPPRRPLLGGDEERGIGMVEIAVRYANGDIDRDLVTEGLASFAVSSQEFRSFQGAINWDPTPFLRLSFSVVRTIADQTPAAFEGDDRDTSYMLRAQVHF